MTTSAAGLDVTAFRNSNGSILVIVLNSAVAVFAALSVSIAAANCCA